MANLATIRLVAFSATAVLALIMMMLLSSNSFVLASTSDQELAYFEEALQKSVDIMTCNESARFIKDHGVFHDQLTHLNEGIIGCNQTKAIIHDVLSPSLRNATRRDGGVDTQLILPPFSCMACTATLCLDHDICLQCCFEGGFALCYFCP